MLAFICVCESKIKISNLFHITSQGFTLCFCVVLPAEIQDHIGTFCLLNELSKYVYL